MGLVHGHPHSSKMTKTVAAAPPPAASIRFGSGTGRPLFFDPLEADGYMDRVPNGLEHLVHAKVRALEGQFGAVTGALHPLGKFGLDSALEGQGDRLCH